jgi:chromatin remodeling complex protein RSC6
MLAEGEPDYLLSIIARQGDQRTRRRTMPTKVPRTKAASGSAGAKKVNPALQKPLRPSAELAAVVGPDPLPRGQAVSRVWGYIKEHGLQNPADRREILADEKLRPVFGKDKVTMFEMNKYLAHHLT